jgi:hypothetical protein
MRQGQSGGAGSSSELLWVGGAVGAFGSGGAGMVWSVAEVWGGRSACPAVTGGEYCKLSITHVELRWQS